MTKRLFYCLLSVLLIGCSTQTKVKDQPQDPVDLEEVTIEDSDYTAFIGTFQDTSETTLTVKFDEEEKGTYLVHLQTGEIDQDQIFGHLNCKGLEFFNDDLEGTINLEEDQAIVKITDSRLDGLKEGDTFTLTKTD